MKGPFPPIWVAVVIALLAAPVLVDDPARAQLGVVAALLVATIPLRRVRGASTAEIAFVLIGAAIATVGVWQAVKGKSVYWILAGLGEATIFSAMMKRADATFGRIPGRAYLVALAMILAATAMHIPESVAIYGVKNARIASAIAAAALVTAGFTAGSSGRTRP